MKKPYNKILLITLLSILAILMVWILGYERGMQTGIATLRQDESLTASQIQRIYEPFEVIGKLEAKVGVLEKKVEDMDDIIAEFEKIIAELKEPESIKSENINEPETTRENDM